MSAKQLMDMQALVRKLAVGDKVVDAILALTRNARPEQSKIDIVKSSVSWGPGPRAGFTTSYGAEFLCSREWRYARVHH